MQKQIFSSCSRKRFPPEHHHRLRLHRQPVIDHRWGHCVADKKSPSFTVLGVVQRPRIPVYRCCFTCVSYRGRIPRRMCRWSCFWDGAGIAGGDLEETGFRERGGESCAVEVCERRRGNPGVSTDKKPKKHSRKEYAVEKNWKLEKVIPVLQCSLPDDKTSFPGIRIRMQTSGV